MKKQLSIIMAAAITCSAIPAMAEEQTAFSDVAEGVYYAQAANSLYALGILSGYGDGTFAPEKNITRAEMASIICTILGKDKSDPTAGGESKFTDVEDSHWAKGFINIASAAGIISGDGDGTFRPSDNVKYEEAVKMLVCAAGLGKDIVFNEADWSAPYITAAQNSGITEKSEQSKGQIAVRGDIAMMVFNATEKLIAVPAADPAPGTYMSIQKVKLSTPIKGVSIYYTTDGTEPTIVSNEYNGEITVSKSTTIKAAAIKSGVISSKTFSGTYAINGAYAGIGNINSGSSKGSGGSGSSGSGGSSSATTRYNFSFADVKNGTVNTSAEGKYERGDKVKISATPNDGYVFTEWYAENGLGSFKDKTSASTTYTMPGKSVSVTPIFGLALDNSFVNPDSKKSGEVSRQEWIERLLNAAGIKIVSDADSAFTDVKSDNPYSDAVNTAAKIELLETETNKSFYPESYATTAFAAVTAVKALGYSFDTINECLKIAKEKEIINDASIESNMTEEQALKILKKVHGLKFPNEKTIDGAKLNADKIEIFDEEGNVSENPSISFYENDETSTRYKLSKDFKLFVNGAEVEINAANIDKYLKAARDIALDGRGDGTYNKVSVSYYTVAKIAAVNSDSVEIVLADETGDTVNTSAKCSVYMDNKKIAVSELKENDILLIKYNVSKALNESDFYEIYACRETKEGILESINTDKETITVDGSEYSFANGFGESAKLLVGNTYKLYLDSFGRVFAAEDVTPVTAVKSFAIINDYSDADGAVVFTLDGAIEKIVVDASAVSEGESLENVIKKLIYNDDNTKKPACERVITYEVSDNKIMKIDIAPAAESADGAAYSAETGSIGEIKLAKDVKIINAADEDNLVVGAPDDTAAYTCSVYGDKDEDGAYKLIVFSKK